MAVNVNDYRLLQNITITTNTGLRFTVNSPGLFGLYIFHDYVSTNQQRSHLYVYLRSLTTYITFASVNPTRLLFVKKTMNNFRI